jgi:hypothetical protein
MGFKPKLLKVVETLSNEQIEEGIILFTISLVKGGMEMAIPDLLQSMSIVLRQSQDYIKKLLGGIFYIARENLQNRKNLFNFKIPPRADLSEEDYYNIVFLHTLSFLLNLIAADLSPKEIMDDMGDYVNDPIGEAAVNIFYNILKIVHYYNPKYKKEEIKEEKRIHNKQMIKYKKDLKEQKKQKRIEKIDMKLLKKKLKQQQKTEKMRRKINLQKQLEKDQNRKNNLFCKNSIEFVTQEDIEDIPTEELVSIKLDKNIFCLDKNSFLNIIKFSQKVRGNCKPFVHNKSLECDYFYPINIGQNIYITEKNYMKIKDITMEYLNKNNKFSLKNKKLVDFTTGLHIVGQKTGKDYVYDLVKDDYPLKNIMVKKIKIKKKSNSMTKKDLINICKEKGVTGYSKLKKEELKKKCLSAKVQKNFTILELKKLCIKKGIKGYSKLNKKGLMKKCLE